MKKQEVAVAMSGGVDSGVAAALLVEQGYEVIGLHLRFWSEGEEEVSGLPRFTQGTPASFINFKGANPNVPRRQTARPPYVENRCCDVEGLEAARKTAAKLGIPFYVKDYVADFKKIVVDYFLAEYAAGRTPNPCVVCNQFIKFGKLLEYTQALGCDYLATGHYARIVQKNSENSVNRKVRESENQSVGSSGPSGVLAHRRPDALSYSEFSGNPRYYLLKGIDDSKDQSYFLWTLTQDKLAHILFPVGGLTKLEVRKIARVKNLPVSERAESFEICFIRDNDYRDFLKRRIPGAIKPGEVVNVSGQVIGRHFGLPLYTIGQRKGFEINLKSQISNLKSGIPLYVVGIDTKRNRLVVGRGVESEKQKFAVGGVSWISDQAPEGEVRCQVRIRHQGELLNSKLKTQNSKLVNVGLDEPVRGITPGQSAVFYQGDEVLGGGVIE